jgi:hypothetical protein
LLCSTTSRPALFVPVSWPASVVEAPGAIGFGLAASETPSGWRRVVNVRHPPILLPSAFWATSR